MAQLNTNSAPEKWFVKHSITTKFLGMVDLFAACIASAVWFGTGAGILIWLFTMILLFSFLILLYPLRIIDYRHLMAIAIVLFFSELALF